MRTELLKQQWQRTVAAVAAVLGVLFLVVGWFGVSGASLTTEQIPYLASGAMGGLFALGTAATLWLSADLRDEYVKLDDIYQVVQHRAGVAPHADGPEERAGAAVASHNGQADDPRDRRDTEPVPALAGRSAGADEPSPARRPLRSSGRAGQR